MDDLKIKGLTKQGEDHPSHSPKLTWDIVHAIRQDERSTRVLAAIYGISQKTISGIKRYRTWRYKTGQTEETYRQIQE